MDGVAAVIRKVVSDIYAISVHAYGHSDKIIKGQLEYRHLISVLKV